MKTDVTILGGGPGGVAAALKAREYGFKTVLVEKKAVGGVCLHQGCIPTKSLITDARRHLSFPEMLAKKERVVALLHQGIVATLKKEGVTVMRGEGKIVREHLVRVGEESFETKFILIATGSRPKEIAGCRFDNERIFSSDTLLQIREIPESLLVVGGGPTGCEFASLYHRLGSRVTLLEATSSLLPGLDDEISGALRKIFLREGIEICEGVQVTSLQTTVQGVLIFTTDGRQRIVEKVLIAIGRSPNSEALGAEGVGISLKDRFIQVDPSMRTSLASIFAVGDVTGKRPLAHVASHQGRVAVDNMAGKARSVEERVIPECIFTEPEVATVGWTEKAAREKGEILIGRSSFFASAKAKILEEKEGFVKLIGESRDGKLLGAHLIGPQVTELLGELTLALQWKLTIPQILETIHPHPTLSESVEEAARDFVQRWKGRGRYTFSDVASKAN